MFKLGLWLIASESQREFQVFSFKWWAKGALGEWIPFLKLRLSRARYDWENEEYSWGVHGTRWCFLGCCLSVIL